jgi:hypothetical protein
MSSENKTYPYAYKRRNPTTLKPYKRNPKILEFTRPNILVYFAKLDISVGSI